MYGILKGVKKARIAVIGDIMLDRYITGSVERISPEAPVPVVFVENESHVLGGAGNVVANLCKLGVANVELFCLISDADSFGDKISRELGNLHYDYNNIRTTYFSCEQTTVKTRVMADNHQIVRFDREIPKPMSNATAIKIIDEVTDKQDELDAILISDYGKGMITESLLYGLQSSIGKVLPICIDPSPKTTYPPMANAIILPNTKEKEKMPPYLSDSFKAVVETAGADGIYIYQPNQEPIHIKAIEVSDVVDTVGAGDTVTAVFTAAIATSATIYEAATLANIAASVVVRHAKTYAVSYDEIFNVIEPYCNP